MADVFISYAHADAAIAAAVAHGLEERGYTTWRYEEKSRLGGSYLERIGREIRSCRAALFVISHASLASPQCKGELVRAHELDKPLLPMRRDISHEDLLRLSDDWAMALKGAVTADITDATAAAMADEAVAVLREQNIEPLGGGPPPAASPLKRLSRGAVHGLPPKDLPLGAMVAGIVGVLGVPYTLYHFGHALWPGQDPEGWVLTHFHGFRTATILANFVGIIQNGLLVRGAMLAHRGDPKGGPLLRTVSKTMLIAIGLWFLVCLFSFSGRNVPPGLVSGAFNAALVAAVPSAAIFALYRKSGQAPAPANP
ncbi:MAG TPA: toll/interleukin-1 receptor domain-containing protein [Thermoanaerobaculia bacterium]|nr:toll/interleukin-1 receptor domain-containing protein [Thermoanaerobaculia bacterium]